ncbi:penicillin-binding protein 2 [Pelagibacterales bacterium SAG-MED18]|nr:penicillin-binding protein 2 [Pelagibacterales bacterium SAG-MED18]MBD1165593.1 penicillin-binding protein 2 [Pelagibacterales bacterium SAG-MED10]
MISSSSDNVTKLNSINRRMFITGSLKFMVMIGLVSRLFFLQVKENKKYLTLSDKNRIREWKLAPVRGEFLDYFGNVIAGNFEAYQLHIIPEEVEDFRYVIYRLKDLLELSDKEFKKVLKKKNESKPWETLIISDNLDWKRFSKINNHLYDLNGVKPVISISRNYPFGENFTHIIGYVSQANENDIEKNEIIKKNFVPGLKVGKVGLEKSLEEKLLGTNDIERYEVNAYGRRISQLEFQKGKKGKTLRLTIDTEVQKLANELLKDKAGSICVMDIFTGSIIAMHSSPSFDPNLFVFGISQDEWQIIRNNPMKPLVNKTLQGNYSPGSTIKPIVALSALENGIINTNFTVKCTGKTDMYGQTYHCWKKKGHGFVSLRNAMKQSCDTYFYEIARKLGVDKLSETAKKFGLGKEVFGDLFSIEKNSKISQIATNKKNTIAVRFPKHPITRYLLRELNFPLAAPSANISSKVSAVSSDDVKDDFGKKIKYVLEGGKSSIGLESTIIDLRYKPKILRLGGLEVSTIKKILNKKITINNNPLKIFTPGQSKLHYSPGIPIRLNVKKIKDKEAYLLIRKRKEIKPNYYYLSKKGDLKEAAKKLYSTLRKIKKNKYRSIAVVKIPNKGLGKTINDRLIRASRF